MPVKLAGETNALLLTLDVWHLKLFGHDVGHEHHDERHERIEKDHVGRCKTCLGQWAEM